MSDTIDRERRAMDVFAAVFEAPAESRAALLDEQCADDVDLRSRVERLLAADSNKGLSDAAADRFLHAAVKDAVATSKSGLTHGGEHLSGVRSSAGEVGDYRILRVVGEGGMGTVYEAEQTNPRRRVAIKVIRGDLRTPRARRRFEYEAQVLASLEHPGIARLYEADVRPSDERTRAHLVMEFVDGVPLDQYVKDNRLALFQKLELFLRICDPIAYAHRMGVIHRDLKPANILVMSDGQPKVLDFGVARTLEMTTSDAALTADGQIVGTLAYMSPEQFDGRAPVDTRTDVYALGVVLHQLLTGRDPIDVNGAGLASAAHKLLNVVPEPIGRHDRRFRGDLETIVSRALEKEPARRYASVEQLAAEVRRHLAGEPIEARADSAAYVLRRAAWRHRHWVLGFAALLAVVTGFAIYASVQSERNNRLAIAAAHARDDASSARETAEQRAEDLRHSLYFANIAFGRVSLAAREVVPLRRALEACDTDLRDWEWYYMRRQADRASRTLDPAGERNTAAEVDPDHRIVAFGLPEGRYRVVSAIDGHTVCSGDIGGEKTKVAVSQDGNFMVAMSTTQMAAISLPDGKQLWRIKKPGPYSPDKVGANSVRISRDNAYIAASDYNGVSLLNASDGSHIRRFNEVKELMTIEFTPDSKGLMLGEALGRLRRLSLEGKTEIEYSGYGSVIQRLGFSDDGHWLAAANYAGRTMIWNAESGQVYLSGLETGGTAIRRIWFSHDNALAFLAGDDRLIRSIDMHNGQVKDVYVGHTDGVLLASPSRDGKQLLSVARDNVIKYWPIPLPPPGRELHKGPEQPGGLAFTRDSATIYAGGYGGKICGWSRKKGPEPDREFGEAANVTCFALNRAGTRLMSGHFDGNMVFWDTAKGAAISRIKCAARPTAVAFSPDEEQVLVGNVVGKLQVWETATGSPKRTLDAHSNGVNAIAFHPNAHAFATAGGDGLIRTWRWPEMTLINEVRCDPRAVTDVVYSPDGRWLLACSESRSPSLRDAQTLQVVHSLVGDGGGIRSANFSPNGRRLVTAGHDGTARIWDAERGRELLSLRCGTAFVNRAVFSPDGRNIATIDTNGSLRIWTGSPDVATPVKPAADAAATPVTASHAGPG